MEQVYWDTSNPDILYYVDNQTFIRYHVNAKTIPSDTAGLQGQTLLGMETSCPVADLV